MDGDRRCGLCGAEALADHRERRLAVCRRCGALERQRALARRFEALLAAGDGRRCLEVGPLSAHVFGGYLRERGWTYRGVDRSARGNPHDPRHVGFVDDELDLTDLRSVVEDEADLVLVQHVIEEIAEHERALDEIARVLAPGGTALLEIPYDPEAAVSVRQAPDHFGNVWRFGRDLEDALRARFAVVEVVALAEQDYRGRLFRCVRGVGAVLAEQVPPAAAAAGPGLLLGGDDALARRLEALAGANAVRRVPGPATPEPPGAAHALVVVDHVAAEAPDLAAWSAALAAQLAPGGRVLVAEGAARRPRRGLRDRLARRRRHGAEPERIAAALAAALEPVDVRLGDGVLLGVYAAPSPVQRTEPSASR